MKYHLKTKGFKVREENSNQSLHWNIQCQSKWKDSKSKIEKYILNLDELCLSLTYNKDENDKSIRFNSFEDLLSNHFQKWNQK